MCVCVCACVCVSVRDKTSTQVPDPGRLHTRPRYLFIFFATRVLGTFHINPPLAIHNSVNMQG